MDKSVHIDKIQDFFAYTFLQKIIALLGIFYFCCDPIHAVLSRIIGYEFSIIIENVVILFASFLLYTGFYLEKIKKTTIWPIYFIAIAAIIFSVLFHPEYGEWFADDEYGLFLNFLQLKKGFYALFIVGMFLDKQKLLSVFTWAARINIFYFLIQYMNASRRGYWEAYLGNGDLVKLNYSLNYGYTVAVYAIFFLGLFLFNRKLLDLVSFITTFMLVVLAGSRGPLLCLAVALVLYELYLWRFHKQGISKLIIALFILIFTVLIVVTGVNTIITAMVSLLRKLNISSRSIEMMLNGTIADDSGRSDIYNIAFGMIANSGLLGYGFYGDRYIIGRSWHFGYPHNIFLELLIQFGILGGGILILILIFNIIRVMVSNKDPVWQLLMTTMFSGSIKLLLSDSFWYFWPFWTMLGVISLWRKENPGKIRLDFRRE